MAAAPATSTTRLALLTVALAAVGGAMIALWIYPEQSYQALERAGVSAAATSLAQSVTEATDGAAAPMLSRLGLADAAEAATSPEAAEKTAASAAPARGDVELPRRRAPRTSPPEIETAAEPPIVEPTVLAPSDPLPGVSLPAPPIVDDRPYTAAEEGVTPARPLRPMFPSHPPPGADPERLGLVELVVDEFGYVEAVRLIRGPRDVLESMLLPAIKAWRFAPAMKDGRPVKYRQQILITY